MREVHLYSSDNPPSLYVDMSGYAIQLKYKKRVRDLASGEIGSVWTFSKAAGVRDGTRATIMLELSNLLDTFLVEYLRANESTCGQMVTGRLKPEEVSTDTPERSPPAADINAAEPSLFRIGNSVKSSRLIRKREPRYTEKAKEAKLEGVVLLELEVWEDGKAHNIRVLRPLGLGLNERAIEAVEKWKFAPGTKDGKPVRVLAQILVSFRLL